MRFVTPIRRRWALNYYITQCTGSSISWWQYAVEKASTQQSGPSGPRLSSPGERKRNAVMANRLGVNMLQFCSVFNTLSHTTLSIKWEVYFSKELCRSSSLRRYISACICICIMWLYNIAGGEDTENIPQLILHHIGKGVSEVLQPMENTNEWVCWMLRGLFWRKLTFHTLFIFVLVNKAPVSIIFQYILCLEMYSILCRY